MISNSIETSAIDQIVDRAVEQNPHAAEILKAFSPIIERQRQLAAASPLAAIDFSSVSKEKLKAGVPVIRQVHVLTESEDLKQMTRALAKALSKACPV